ncbi:MAG TPA: hypothetical protein VGB14_09750 [Acidimicrobiales bacterium]
MPYAVRLAVNPAAHEQIVVLWSDGRLQARGGALPPETPDYAPDDDDSTAMPTNDYAVDFVMTDWLEPSGYVFTARRKLFAFGAAAMPDVPPVSTGDNRWRAILMNPSATGAGYTMDWFGRLFEFGNAAAIAGTDTILTPNSAPIARDVAMDYPAVSPSRKYIVVDAEGRLYLRNGATLGPGVLPDVTPGWQRVVALWVDPDSWAAGARGYTLDTYGTVFGFGGLPENPPHFKHWETAVAKDFAVLTAEPLTYIVLDYNGVPWSVVASDPPTTEITGPASPVTTTTQPTVPYNFFDPDGNDQRDAELLLFPDGPGHPYTDPTAAGDPFLTATTTGNFFAFTLDTDLPNGTWWAYVRATDTSGRTSAWDSHEFEQAVVPPSPPPLTVEPDAATPGPAAILQVGERVEVTLHGKAGTFGALEGDTTLPRGQAFRTRVLEEDDDYPSGSQQFFAVTCPDGQIASTVIPWSGSQFAPSPLNTMSVVFFDPATETRYRVQVSTSEGLWTAPGYGGDVSDLVVVQSADGPRLIGWSMRPYDGDWNLTAGQFPAMVGFRRNNTTGRWELDPDRTFTTDELYLAARHAGPLGATADLCFPVAINPHGQSYRLAGGYGETAVLSDGDMVVVHYLQENDLGGSGRSGRLMAVSPEGMTTAFRQIEDMTDLDGAALGLLPRDCEACDVDVSAGPVLSIVYDSFATASGAPYPALLQLWQRVGDTFDPLTPALLPPNDFATGTETLAVNVDAAYAVAGFVNGHFYGMTAHANAETGNPFATLNSRSAQAWRFRPGTEDWSLLDDAPAAAGWENRAGTQPVGDYSFASLSDQVGGNRSARGVHFDPATGAVVVPTVGGYVMVFVPDDDDFERRHALPSNEEFDANVSGWAAVSGTTNAPTWEATDGGRMKVVKNAFGTTGIVGTGASPTAIPVEYRDGRQGAFVGALVKFSVACDFRVSLTYRTAAGTTIFTYDGPWRKGSTTEYRPVVMQGLIPTTGATVSRAISFRNAAAGVEMYVKRSVQDIPPAHFTDHVNLNLADLQAAGPTGSRFSAVKAAVTPGVAWVPVPHAKGTATLDDDDVLAQYLYAVPLATLLLGSGMSAEIQFSDDGGATWQTVKRAEALELGSSLAGSVVDEEVPVLGERLYRARVYSSDPVLSSNWSESVAYTSPDPLATWLSDPDTPGSAVSIIVPPGWTLSTDLPSDVFWPDGRGGKAVVLHAEHERGLEGPLPVTLLDEATHHAVEALLRPGRTLLLRDKLGRSWYLARSGSKELENKRGRPPNGSPYPVRYAHDLTVDVVEVGRL